VRSDVVVVGGGLAGLTCAFELSTRGYVVRLLEARPVVGGRTSSWVQDGMPVESGLHRVLGFYTHFPDLLRRAGINIDDIVYWEDEVEIRLPDGGGNAVLGAAPIYRPIDTVGGAFNLLRLLSARDLASLPPFLAGGLIEYFVNPAGLDRTSVVEKARSYGVTEPVIQRLLVPLTSGLYFLPPERYSSYVFFATLGPYLQQLYATRVGAFRGGMTEVMAAPLAAALERNGGRVDTNSPAERLLVDSGKVVGVETRRGRITATHVVLATSLAPAQHLIRQSLPQHPWFEPMLRLPSMPAVTIQAELDGPSMAVDHTTFGPGTALASFAEQSRTTFRGLAGRISIILTPPERFIGQSDRDILDVVCEHAQRLDLRVMNHVVRYRVVRLPADFYLLSPGTDALRPPQRTPVPGLTLAGDYTRQKFIATMEGAVVSGQLAADAVQAVAF
jgi:15-cis-phytoene desaturase